MSFIIFLISFLMMFTAPCYGAPIEVVEEAAETAASLPYASEEAEEIPYPEYNIVSLHGYWDTDDADRNLILPDGEVLTRSWVYDSGLWYYVDSDGSLMTGQAKIKGKRYYFYESGVMATGWCYDAEGDKWYYADESGELHKGWLPYGDIWYWFDSSYTLHTNGLRAVQGRKYHFFRNGQMAGNKFVGLNYYNSDGAKTNDYKITLKGKRSPTSEEKEAISEAMAEIPAFWVKRFVEDGWELMFYTDRKYFSAPSTDNGIYYVCYETDPKYKKMKFTKPSDLRMAFGEYIAYKTANYSNIAEEYLRSMSIAGDCYLGRQLPDYYSGDVPKQFAYAFEAWCSPSVKMHMKWEEPEELRQLDALFHSDSFLRKPEDAEDYALMIDEMNIEGMTAKGPAMELKKR